MRGYSRCRDEKKNTIFRFEILWRLKRGGSDEQRHTPWRVRRNQHHHPHHPSVHHRHHYRYVPQPVGWTEWTKAENVIID